MRNVTHDQKEPHTCTIGWNINPNIPPTFQGLYSSNSLIAIKTYIYISFVLKGKGFVNIHNCTITSFYVCSYILHSTRCLRKWLHEGDLIFWANLLHQRNRKKWALHHFWRIAWVERSLGHKVCGCQLVLLGGTL